MFLEKKYDFERGFEEGVDKKVGRKFQAVEGGERKSVNVDGAQQILCILWEVLLL